MKNLIRKFLFPKSEFNAFGKSLYLKQDMLLFDDCAAAKEVAFMLSAHWDGCNGVTMHKYDEVAVNTAASLVGAKWCYGGESLAFLSRLPADELIRLYAAGVRNFTNANLRCALLNSCLLSEVNLSRAKLSWADLSEANLSRADLTAADLSEANLSGANLSQTSLMMANLNRANLSLVDLRGADISKACLNGVNLSQADLRGANLSFADLRGANLSRAALKRANLTGTKLTLNNSDIDELLE